jgi:hypothetical protein
MKATPPPHHQAAHRERTPSRMANSAQTLHAWHRNSTWTPYSDVLYSYLGYAMKYKICRKVQLPFKSLPTSFSRYFSHLIQRWTYINSEDEAALLNKLSLNEHNSVTSSPASYSGRPLILQAGLRGFSHSWWNSAFKQTTTIYFDPILINTA